MSTEVQEIPRDEASIREEIEDLSQYLAGIPEALRKNGAFMAYEARLEALQAKLSSRKSTSDSGSGNPHTAFAAKSQD